MSLTVVYCSNVQLIQVKYLNFAFFPIAGNYLDGLFHRSSLLCDGPFAASALIIAFARFSGPFVLNARPLSATVLTVLCILFYHNSVFCAQPFFDTVETVAVMWPHHPLLLGDFLSAVYS